jgi:hypothetical protein
MDEREITTSTTQIQGAHTLVPNIEDTNRKA